jgi:hypothetical protein
MPNLPTNEFARQTGCMRIANDQSECWSTSNWTICQYFFRAAEFPKSWFDDILARPCPQYRAVQFRPIRQIAALTAESARLDHEEICHEFHHAQGAIV